MKKYIVVSLYLGGLSNKIFNSGDAVTADCFPDGHAEELVASGHLREFTEGVDALKRTVTEQDLIEHPELVERGVKAGDVFEMDPTTSLISINGVVMEPTEPTEDKTGKGRNKKA